MGEEHYVVFPEMRYQKCKYGKLEKSIKLFVKLGISSKKKENPMVYLPIYHWSLDDTRKYLLGIFYLH